MDQTQILDSILKEANITGFGKEVHLPDPIDGPNLSKLDCATDDERPKCSKYPYRRVVGQATSYGTRVNLKKKTLGSTFFKNVKNAVIMVLE